MPHRLLVVEAFSESSISAALEREQFHCERQDWSAFLACPGIAADVQAVVLVSEPSGAEIVAVAEWLTEHPIAQPILAIVPSVIDASMLRLLAHVADDVVFAPVRMVELHHRLARLAQRPETEIERIRSAVLEEIGLSNLVGKDPAFLQAIAHLPRYARTDLGVLITGETGTGKELCARAIHALGRRRECPFLAVDCGAVPEQLFENELFGHAKGAFTDAHRDHKGYVALATGGTLFLDEIDALALSAQAKLLRFLQERTYRPLGSERLETANVRIVVATNRDLENCVKDGRFRSDLLFRLNVLRIHLPPLRDRRGDIELLAYNALKDCAQMLERPPGSIAPAALRQLAAYEWPGNVRELVNVMQRAAVACSGDQILAKDLALSDPGPAPVEGATNGGAFRAQRAAMLERFEKQYVEDMLRKHDGNVTHAAREAQQNRRVFGRFMKKYKIDRQASRT